MTMDRQGKSSRFDRGDDREAKPDTEDDPRAPGKRTRTAKLLAPDTAKDPANAQAKSEQPAATTEPKTEPQKTEPQKTEPEHTEETTAEDPGELREAEAWLAEAQSALAVGRSELEAHVCYAGCVHGQFDRMLSGFGSATEDKLDVAALQAAYTSWLKKQAAKLPEPHAERGAAEPHAEEPGDVEHAHQADPAPASPTPELTPDPTGDAPVGHAIATFSATKHARFPNIMGEAPFPKGFKFPELKLKFKQEDVLVHSGGPTSPGKGQKEWITEVEPTTSTDGTTTVIVTPQGVHPIAGTATVEDDKGKKIVMKRAIRVSSAAAAQIKQAEQEHVDDYTRAYEITIKAAEKAVNDAAKLMFSDKNKAKSIKQAKDAIKDALDPKLTANPQTWVAMLNRCIALSKTGRDASHTHDFTHDTQLPDDADFTNKIVIGKVLPNSKLGTASASLIKL